MKKYCLFVLSFLGGFVFIADALSDNLRRAVNPPALQEAKELQQVERRIDQGIKRMNDNIAYYKKLKNIEIKLTPGRTIFRKNPDKGYIEIESYSFIPESAIHTNLVGIRYKVMRLYYGQGVAASKVETEIFEQNFLTHEKRQSSIVDPSPDTLDMNDVTLTSQLNQNKPAKFSVGKMENTISRPMRIRFKKNYLNHLINFEKLLRFTEEFQIKYGIDTDRQIISNLKNSLKY